MKLQSIKVNNDGSEKDSIDIILSTEHIESVNSMYNARVGKKGNKHFPIIYKSSQAVRYTEEIVDQLKSIDFHTECPWMFDEKCYFDVAIQFVMNRSFNARDLDNCLKITTDAIFGHTLELNDSRIVCWKAWKTYLPDSKEEFIMVRISKSNFEFIFREGIN
jgi:Holliday junction resolvase RusA-like endonuclease